MKKQPTALKYENLYNGDIKKQFVETYDSIDSKLTIFWQFLKISEHERESKKDISEMTPIEVEKVLRAIECSTVTSAINHINTYKRYIDWLSNSERTINKDIKNPFGYFEPLSELAISIVAKHKNRRYTKEELMFMIDELNNYTDQALLLALFEGIKGKSFSELLTLKVSNLSAKEDEEGNDIYFAKVYDEGKRDYRTLKISRELYKLIILADKQVSYRTNNELEVVETPFNESEFVFKKGKKGKQGNSNLDRHFLTRKFVFFKEFFGNDSLTVDDIVQSGMMHMAYESYLKKGKIDRETLLEIGEQYDTVMVASQRTGNYRNITFLKRTVLSEQFYNLYDIEEQII